MKTTKLKKETKKTRGPLVETQNTTEVEDIEQRGLNKETEIKEIHTGFF